MHRYLAKLACFNFVILPVIACTVLCSSQNCLAFNEQVGSLELYLKSFSYGVKADNQWKEPDSLQMATFDAVINSFFQGDFNQASQLAENSGYSLIQFTDTDDSVAKVYYILTEKYCIGEPGFQGGGIFVMYPEGNNFAIEAPHPRSDLNTEREAIELYLASSSRYLFLAGTRRDSSTQHSTCSGEYYKSDVVHHTNTLFQVAHERLDRTNSDTVFINLHAFGSTSLAKLQQQCNTTDNNLINMSEGVNAPPQLDPDTSFMAHLARQIDLDGTAAVCIYGIDTETLGGTYATNGRITNDSADACNENAIKSSQRFVHLEQSYKLRSTNRSEIVGSIASAIQTFYQVK